MGAYSKIEWCHHTHNFWVGCEKVSQACKFCYAEGWAKRTGSPELWRGQRRRTTAENWRQPLRWNRQAAALGQATYVFANSMADFFDADVPREWRSDAWELIRRTPALTWLLLTKRPQNIERMVPDAWGDGWPNVWLGTTVENQEEADRRIPHLLGVPAKLHFLSCEPLLAPVDLTRIVKLGMADISGNARHFNALTSPVDTFGHRAVRVHREIGWVIVGGESGPNARPMYPDWARALRDQCVASGTAFYMKQMGGTVKAKMPEIPGDLMIWEFPDA